MAQRRRKTTRQRTSECKRGQTDNDDEYTRQTRARKNRGNANKRTTNWEYFLDRKLKKIFPANFSKINANSAGVVRVNSVGGANDGRTGGTHAQDLCCRRRRSRPAPSRPSRRRPDVRYCERLRGRFRLPEIGTASACETRDRRANTWR